MIDQKFLFEQGRTEEDGERDRRKPRKEKEKSIRIWEKRSLQIMWPIEGSRKRSKGGKVQILKNEFTSSQPYLERLYRLLPEKKRSVFSRYDW